MKLTLTCITTTLLSLASPALASPDLADPFAGIGTYDRADYDRTITACDRLAGHPSDPESVTPGLSRSDMDLPAAIAACQAAIMADPDNPRLNYQLARAYGYSGQHAAGDPYRAQSLSAGYPQALFVYGYIRLEGWDGRPADPCYGGELVRRSALAGRYAGLVGFPHYVQIGAFEHCETYPRISSDEIADFLNQAENRAENYYQTILVRTLKAHFQQMD